MKPEDLHLHPSQFAYVCQDKKTTTFEHDVQMKNRENQSEFNVTLLVTPIQIWGRALPKKSALAAKTAACWQG